MPSSIDSASAAARQQQLILQQQQQQHMQVKVQHPKAQHHVAHHTQQAKSTQPQHARRRATGHSTHDTFTPANRAGAPTIGAGTPKEQSLANAARNTALGMGGYHGRGRCATGVERAVSSALHTTVNGNGNSIGASLKQHGFHEVNMSLSDALKTPGLVLTWQHTPTKLGQKYGHTAVTLGDGHSSASDFVERNTVAGSAGRTGLHIYALNNP